MGGEGPLIGYCVGRGTSDRLLCGGEGPLIGYCVGRGTSDRLVWGEGPLIGYCVGGGTSDRLPLIGVGRATLAPMPHYLFEKTA